MAVMILLFCNICHKSFDLLIWTWNCISSYYGTVAYLPNVD